MRRSPFDCFWGRAAQVEDGETPVPQRRSTYRGWAELLKRTFDFDVLSCPSCGGRMKLLALVTSPRASRATCVPSVNRPTRLVAHRAVVPHFGRVSSCAEKRSATSRSHGTAIHGPRLCGIGVP